MNTLITKTPVKQNATRRNICSNQRLAKKQSGFAVPALAYVVVALATLGVNMGGSNSNNSANHNTGATTEASLQQSVASVSNTQQIDYFYESD